MNRDETKLIAKKFRDNFAKYQGKDNDFYKDFVMRLEAKFRHYEYSDVNAGLDKWLEGHNVAPLFDELELETQKAKKCFKPISQEEFDTPTVWTKYFEDSDGYGYALSSKDNQYDCIWKPHWANQGRSKMVTLKEHGIINYV